MNSIITKYILKRYFKDFLKVVFFFYCFGLILNLFEEIEFFKKLNVSILTPLKLSNLVIPSLIIQLLPFIIFIVSIKCILDIRDNKDLLTIKVFGFSNFKIFSIIASTSFLLGWLILIFINPVTSTMLKYYDKTKSQYSKDVDHLVSINKNGLWIKENLTNGQRIISASRKLDKNLKDVTIFNFDKEFNIKEKIFSSSADISQNEWILNEVLILKINDSSTEQIRLKSHKINSIYTYDKISNLFKNVDTISFVDLLLKYDNLLDKGYSHIFLNQSFHSMLSMPFFLFIMTALASILIMGTLKKSNHSRIIVVSIFSCVVIYYLKDLSIALGHTNRVPLSLSYWIPIIVISIFSSIGLLQINEK